MLLPHMYFSTYALWFITCTACIFIIYVIVHKAEYIKNLIKGPDPKPMEVHGSLVMLADECLLESTEHA